MIAFCMIGKRVYEKMKYQFDIAMLKAFLAV